MMFKRTGTDKTIYACTIFLALFGIVMIGDASVGMSASEGSNFATKNLLKQCLFVIVGLGFMFLFARAYKTRRISETLMLVTYGVCILMMLTCIMWTINNSHAWIKIGPFTISACRVYETDFDYIVELYIWRLTRSDTYFSTFI